ncbi:MAG: hypothetical protein GF328_01695 [Candidatus Latescibacteria bacterium]|nr:hypothetical protein [Candidatus Latescibacterota bacterium]
MQFGLHKHEGPPPRGPERWLPQLVIGLTSIALTIALAYFLLVAYQLRDRFGLPPGMIPIAMGVAAILVLTMAVRAFVQLRSAFRSMGAGRRSRRGDG